MSRGFLSSFPVLIAIVAYGPAARAATVTVRTPASVICVHGSTRAEIASFSGTQTIKWDDADAVVKCDGEGVEPRDLSAADSSVTILPARTVILRLPEPQAVAVEWIGIEEEGPRILASRSFAPQPEIELPVAKDQRRWLRIRRPEASPETLSVSERERAVIEVPAARKGGEIFGRLEKQEFMPLSVATWPDGTLADVNDGVFSLPGIPPRKFQLRAIYEGGLEQYIGVNAQVENVESTWVDLKKMRPVAAVSTHPSPDLCVAGGTILLSADGKLLSERPIDPDACGANWEGVSPQTVTLRLRHPEDGIVASKEVLLEGGRLEHVILNRNTPLLRGRVLMGETPAPDARIQFRRGSDRVDILSDFDGRYEARLPHAGSWTISSFISQYGHVAGETHEFRAGEQEFDVVLEAGRLRVTVTGEGGEGKHSQLALRGPTTANAIVRIGEVVDLIGLPLGKYVAEARSPGVGATELSVDLTKEKPTADVTLELESNEVIVSVVGPDGSPVSGATVHTGIAGSFSEFAAGLFRVENVRDLHPVRVVAAGFEPHCGVLRAPRTTFRLVPAGAHVARFITKRAGTHGFAVSGFLGTDCAVLHGDLPRRLTADGFEVQGLNPGDYQIRFAGKTFDFRVPGPPVDLDAP